MISSSIAETKLSLSRDKKAFFDSKDQKPVQLHAKELSAIASHYFQKLGIRIIINGETPYGRTQIKLQYEQLKKKGLLDENVKYALYVQEQWNQCPHQGNDFFISREDRSKFTDVYGTIFKAIHEFLIGDRKIRPDLTKKDLEKLNKILIGLPCFTTLQQGFSKYYQEKLDCCFLDTNQCVNEIRKIQQALGENEKVGYLFTFGWKESHVEAAIITKKTIIKPVQWFTLGGNIEHRFSRDQRDHLYLFPITETSTVIPSAKDSSGVKIAKGDFPRSPQRESGACATLAMLYLKELLKDNAKQLHEYTLQFPYYETYTYRNESQLSYFYFPSPQCLRYSEVSAYNKIVHAMLMDDSENDTIEVEHNKKTYTVRTLKSILRDSIKIALSKHNEEADKIAELNQQLLKDLPKFRKVWDAEYQSAEAKRALMCDRSDSVIRRHLGLSKRTRDMKEHAGRKSLVRLIPDEKAENKDLAEEKIKKNTITGFEFKLALDSYESTSWLLFLGWWLPGIDSYGSTAMRELSKLSSKPFVSNDQIKKALSADSVARYSLFGDDSIKGNGTSTDDVIVALRSAFN